MIRLQILLAIALHLYELTAHANDQARHPPHVTTSGTTAEHNTNVAISQMCKSILTRIPEACPSGQKLESLKGTKDERQMKLYAACRQANRLVALCSSPSVPNPQNTH